MSVTSELSSFAVAWLRGRPMCLVHRTGMITVLLVVLSVPAFLDAPKSSLIAQYRKAGFAALRADKYEVADLYFRRLGRLDSRDMEGRYGMALAAEQLGNLPLAHRLMQGLAYGENMYPLAHNWLAEKILDDCEDGLSEDDFWQVQRHLETAAADPAARIHSHALLGSMLIGRDLYHEAIPHLVAVVDARPELWIPLARAYSAIGETDQAAFETERALAHFRAMSLATPGSADCCLLRVQCEIMAGEMDAADRVLRRACVRFPDDKRFTEALQDMHIQASDQAIAASRFGLGLKHLDEALKVDPCTTGIFERFARIAGTETDEARIALEHLHEAAAEGRAPGAAHLAIGGAMLRRGQMQQAIAHFELGLRHNPNNVALLNNLAWCLATDKPSELKRALILIDAALTQAPLGNAHRAEVLQTRGEILCRLGRWSEAIVDLERALPNLMDPGPAHAALARAYENTGVTDMARVHQAKRRARTAETPTRTPQ